ncbi:MAG: DUF1801 domain-containing protein [Microbacterium sp.]|uniref:DUF1801 domain-containing protein n=1 Tax=Microbacterium sp. TaxID=51671 RepID=UPI0026394DA7|nr:DUF1801 domain-containing protein [Microbacterium sp.]MCX6502512.1 DUF1801 domain-containing protein [Microbacterium sp.]
MERTGADVGTAIAKTTPAARRRDAETMHALMAEVTGREPEMWAGGIIGYGACHYRYPTGTQGHSPIIGFAPRKAALTVYLLDGVSTHAAALADLGPHRTGVGCLYFPDLAGVDLDLLRTILVDSYRRILDGGTSEYATLTLVD